MKLIILQEKLKEGLNVVERITSKSLTLPILGNILLRAQKNSLSLSATDLEIGINWQILAKTEEEGQIIIPSQTISSLIGLFPNKPVTVSAKGLTANIECENHKSSFKSLSPDEFPIIPLPNQGECLKLPTDVFCRGIGQVANIASLSSIKPEISGVYLNFQGKTIKIVATDSFRLGEKMISLKSGEGLPDQKSFILPQRAAREVINIFGEKETVEGEINLYFSSNQVMFESQPNDPSVPKIQFVSRLIDGEFPNYQEIVPQKYETQAILSKKDFLNQIKSASIFSGKAGEVKLSVDPAKDRVEISSQNQDLGDYRSELPSKIKGKALEITFNHKFLIEGIVNLSSEKSEELSLELSGEEGAAVLKSANDSNYIYILMPIRKN